MCDREQAVLQDIARLAVVATSVFACNGKWTINIARAPFGGCAYWTFFPAPCVGLGRAQARSQAPVIAFPSVTNMRSALGQRRRTFWGEILFRRSLACRILRHTPF